MHAYEHTHTWPAIRLPKGQWDEKCFKGLKTVCLANGQEISINISQARCNKRFQN